jgi:hypothetical protein
MKYTPENITSLKDNEVFVFGSNKSGIHGAGIAKQAYLMINGARWGMGVGHFGKTYAIPTKGKNKNTIHTPYRQKPFFPILEISEIKKYVDQFIQYAIEHPEYVFLVTKIGCGLAGFTAEQIKPLFKEALEIENIVLPKEFH